MTQKNLIIRVDISSAIGSGHIMRCLALAQKWQEQRGQVIFILANQAPALESRLLLEGMKVVYLSVESGSNEDAIQTIDFSQIFTAGWIVVDGYHFQTTYQKAIKSAGIRSLFLDDYGHAKHYYSDLVLNQNISANESLYNSRESYTKLLLGTAYTLLRKEFWQRQPCQKIINPIAHKILVTLGGSDPDNVTFKVIQALQQITVNDLEVIVVVGGSNPHYERLQAEVAMLHLTISLQRDVNNMPELMAWANIAIAAGGSTNWELAFMGLPSLVITIADNQKAIASELDRQGVIINLGWYQSLSVKDISLAIQRLINDVFKREDMSNRGQLLVDGMGSQRVVTAMAEVCKT